MKDFTDSILSYSAVVLAYMSTLHWSDLYNVVMPVGSVILLVARLYVDVPRAIARWRIKGGSDGR